MSNTIDNTNLIKSIVNDKNSTLDSNVNLKKDDSQQQGSKANLADTVSITDAARKLASVENLNKDDMPIYDNNKIDAIKQQIADGTFDIDSKAIADKLLEFE